MRAASVAAVAVVALVLAGCGGSSAPPRHRIHLTAFEKAGRALFILECGTCHTLADAGTGGIVGPDIDSPPRHASQVRKTIANGFGQMPPVQLTARKVAAIAAYVAAATK